MFCMLRARILLLFEAFAGGFPRPCVVRDMFFMDSKGDVPRVFQGCVLHASSTNPAAVQGFRRQFSKAMCRDVSRVFQACVLHASGTNPAAVRSFRKSNSDRRLTSSQRFQKTFVIVTSHKQVCANQKKKAGLVSCLKTKIR